MRNALLKLAIAMAIAGVVPAMRAADAMLRVEGVAGRDGGVRPALVLSGADLGAMARTTERVRGHDGKEHVYEGVLVTEILKRAGQTLGEGLRGKLLASYVLASARDGYRVVFTLPDFDPGYTDARALVADRMDGKPLSDRDGPLRLVMPNDRREARSVRMLEKLEIVILH